jgi:hypothetical protein
MNEYLAVVHKAIDAEPIEVVKPGRTLAAVAKSSEITRKPPAARVKAAPVPAPARRAAR